MTARVNKAQQKRSKGIASVESRNASIVHDPHFKPVWAGKRPGQCPELPTRPPRRGPPDEAA